MRSIFLFLALASSAVIIAALFGQYALSWYPCELCIYQRIPHIAVIVLASAGFFFNLQSKSQRFLIAACLIALSITGSLALYHAGVEADIFAGPTACSSQIVPGQTLEELRAQIEGAALVSCKQAMAYVFGLSLAVWNAIISFGIILIVWLRLKRKSA